MVIVSVKHFERDPSEWTLKARIVFRGDAVKNQEGLSAVFDELAASAPSSIAGLNFVIAWGQAPGHKCSTADAVKAFIQAPLSTRVETWVILPPELVPRKFSHVVRPCARLRKVFMGIQSPRPTGGSTLTRHCSRWEAKNSAVYRLVTCSNLLKWPCQPTWMTLRSVVKNLDIAVSGWNLGNG